MPTKLNVFNGALLILAQPIMVSPFDVREDGKLLRERWEAAVNAAYEIGDWNSAIVRKKLSQSATAPEWGYKYYYPLPPDFVRMVQINSTGQRHDDDIEYQIEGKGIATDASDIYIRYVSSELLVLVPGEWSQSFADYVSASLAFLVAPKINASQLQAASQIMEQRRKVALAVDAVQSPPEIRKPGNFVRAVRYGSRTGWKGAN